MNRLCEQFTLEDSTILALNWQNRPRSQVLETELSDLTHLVEIETNEAVPVEVIHKAKDCSFQVMRKVWINKRKGVKGWWVGWYESGKRKTKAFPCVCMLVRASMNGN